MDAETPVPTDAPDAGDAGAVAPQEAQPPVAPALDRGLSGEVGASAPAATELAAVNGAAGGSAPPLGTGRHMETLDGGAATGRWVHMPGDGDPAAPAEHAGQPAPHGRTASAAAFPRATLQHDAPAAHARTMQVAATGDSLQVSPHNASGAGGRANKATKQYKTQAIKEPTTQQKLGRFVVFEEKFLPETEWHSLAKAPSGSLAAFESSLAADATLRSQVHASFPQGMSVVAPVVGSYSVPPIQQPTLGLGPASSGTAAPHVGTGPVVATADARPRDTAASAASMQHQFNTAASSMKQLKESLGVFARALGVRLDGTPMESVARRGTETPTAAQMSKLDALSKRIEKLGNEKRELQTKVRSLSKKNQQTQQAVIVLTQKLQRCGEAVPDIVEEVLPPE